MPVAVFLLAVWVLHLDHERMRRVSAAYPGGRGARRRDVVHPAPIHLTALVMAVLTGLLVAARRPASSVIG